MRKGPGETRAKGLHTEPVFRMLCADDNKSKTPLSRTILVVPKRIGYIIVPKRVLCDARQQARDHDTGELLAHARERRAEAVFHRSYT